MEYFVRGDEKTVGRFRQYLAEHPAARRGWVDSAGDHDGFQVADEYEEPFREIAANFGLEAAPREGPESLE